MTYGSKKTKYVKMRLFAEMLMEIRDKFELNKQQKALRAVLINGIS